MRAHRCPTTKPSAGSGSPLFRLLVLLVATSSSACRRELESAAGQHEALLRTRCLPCTLTAERHCAVPYQLSLTQQCVCFCRAQTVKQAGAAEPWLHVNLCSPEVFSSRLLAAHCLMRASSRLVARKENRLVVMPVSSTPSCV